MTFNKGVLCIVVDTKIIDILKRDTKYRCNERGDELWYKFYGFPEFNLFCSYVEQLVGRVVVVDQIPCGDPDYYDRQFILRYWHEPEQR